jgi:hypothetical protein
VKLNIPQCDDVIRLCKQCKLQELEEEIENALVKADSFGRYHEIRIEPTSLFNCTTPCKACFPSLFGKCIDI